MDEWDGGIGVYVGERIGMVVCANVCVGGYGCGRVFVCVRVRVRVRARVCVRMCSWFRVRVRVRVGFGIGQTHFTHNKHAEKRYNLSLRRSELLCALTTASAALPKYTVRPLLRRSSLSNRE